MLDIKKESRIYGLDIIRAIAILLVIWVHGKNQILIKFIPSFLNFPVPNGVDLFFVLSGFLIGGIIIKSYNSEEKNIKTLIKFWKRRWLRTLPLYYIAIVLFLLLSIILNIQALSNGFNFLFFIFLQNFSYSSTDFFKVSWSLAVEEWFYLLFPLILFASYNVLKKRIDSQKIFVSLIYFLLLFPLILRIFYFFSLNELNESVWNSGLKYILIYRLDSIMFGVWMVYIYKIYTEKIVSLKNVLLISGILLFSLNYYLSFTDYLYTSLYGYTFFYTTNAFAIALTLPFLAEMKNYKTPIGKLLTYVSIISYSLYIFHSFVYVIIRHSHKPKTPSEAAILFFIYILISFTIATLSYLFIEKPFLKLREKKIIQHI